MRVVTTKAAQAEVGKVSLEQVKLRFVQWRSARKRGERISNEMWSAAVDMAHLHGVQSTSTELRVDPHILKRRLDQFTAAQVGALEPQFVEMFAAPALGAAPMARCVVEMENVQGGRMRVELASLDGLAGLANAFWSAR